MTPLLFYVIDEHTDDIKYCKKKGMKPYNVINGKYTQYEYKGYIYDVLECGECYSGYMVTLMRLPELSFNELLNVALGSKYYEERFGALGIILKDYNIQFEKYLQLLSDDAIYQSRKNIQRMVDRVLDLHQWTSYVCDMHSIMNECEGVKNKIYAMRK